MRDIIVLSGYVPLVTNGSHKSYLGTYSFINNASALHDTIQLDYLSIKNEI